MRALQKLIVLLLLCPLMAKAQNNTVRSVVLPPDTAWLHALFDKQTKAWTPAATDLEQAETLLSTCFTVAKQNKQFGVKRNLSEYTRQYMCGIDKNGHQVIWINCVCHFFDPNDTSWEKTPYMVDDGGDCYFSVKIDLTEKKYFDLMINGNA
jgi:hypothetical protein